MMKSQKSGNLLSKKKHTSAGESFEPPLSVWFEEEGGGQHATRCGPRRSASAFLLGKLTQKPAGYSKQRQREAGISTANKSTGLAGDFKNSANTSGSANKERGFRVGETGFLFFFIIVQRVKTSANC